VGLDVGGRAVEPNARYTVATIDFIANGGDGQPAFRGARVLVPATSGLDLPTLVLQAIEAKKTIAPSVEGRIRALPPRSRSPYTVPRAREDRTVAGPVACREESPGSAGHGAGQRPGASAPRAR